MSPYLIWIRLQRQIAAIAGEYPHQMGPEDQERASRNRFYEGLRSELKHPLKYLVGRPEGATYSDLIEEVRRMEGRACGPVLPTEFNGPAPKKDGANTDGYPRSPRRANYFQKVKGMYRPGVRATQVEPTAIEELEASAAEEADDDNFEDILTSIWMILSCTLRPFKTICTNYDEYLIDFMNIDSS